MELNVLLLLKLIVLFLGALFFFMLISVLAFRQPPPSPPPEPPLSSTISDTAENSTIPLTNEERSQDEEAPQPSIQYSNSRRSRGMTLAQVLPLFISSVPVRSAVTIRSAEPSAVRRHSLVDRTRNRTISTVPSSGLFNAATSFQRARANTIAIPLQTMRKLDRSLEQIREPIHAPALSPINSTENNSEQEEEEKEEQNDEAKPLPTQVQIEILEESPSPSPPDDGYWILNGRFLLFCFSNFALCLVMGVPYVIIPRYISETFEHQGFLASWTLSNVGIASALGQILLGYLHDRKIFSAWLMYTLAVIISGASLVILALFRYKTIVLICAFMYGLAISANYALQVLIVIDALSMDKMAEAFGILQFCQGVSTLIGIPIQGMPYS